MKVKYFDSITNFNQTGSSIDYKAGTEAKKSTFSDAISNIALDVSSYMLLNTSGTFARYATVEDQLTDITLTAKNEVIDPTRVAKWFKGAGSIK